MSFQLSKLTISVAIGLLVAHIGLMLYMPTTGMTYDGSGWLQVLRWVTALWLLPLLGGILIILNWTSNWWRQVSGGEDIL